MNLLTHYWNYLTNKKGYYALVWNFDNEYPNGETVTRIGFQTYAEKRSYRSALNHCAFMNQQFSPKPQKNGGMGHRIAEMKDEYAGKEYTESISITPIGIIDHVKGEIITAPGEAVLPDFSILSAKRITPEEEAPTRH